MEETFSDEFIANEQTMHRKILDNLEEWRLLKDRMPIIVKGARQVGKTYLLKEWGRVAFDRVHYVNFEQSPAAAKMFEQDFDTNRIVEDLAFFLKTTIRPQTDLVIFDEIQAAPKALTALKYFCEDAPQLAVCAAGSLLGVILSDESFPVGKVHFLHMHPLSFEEFLMAVDEREAWKKLPEPALDAKLSATVHEHLWDMAKLYYAVGGMPAAVNAFVRYKSSPATVWKRVRDVQRSLITGYENDFAKHAGKINAAHIQVLYRSIPSQLAEYHDDSTKRFKFGDVMSGRKGFAAWERPLHWLVHAGLVLQVKIANQALQPLEHFCRTNLFKLYVHDIGLLGCLQDLATEAIRGQDYGLAKGYFAENFVAQELRACHAEREWPLYSWHEGEAQIEFVRATAAGVVPIEVKAGHRTKAKSLAEFVRKYAPPLSIKISANNLSYDAATGRLNLPLYLASWASLL